MGRSIVLLGVLAVVLCHVVTAQQVHTLSNGVPFHGVVPSGEYMYFRLQVTSASANVSIDVSPLSGDPDLYVSCGPHLPSSSSNTWHANHFGRDYVDIQFDDDHHCAGSSGYFMIAVYGWRNSTFLLTATAQTGAEHQVLVDGVPISDDVDQGEHKYYQVYVRDDSNLEITLTPRSGDPDLAVDCVPFPSISSARWTRRSIVVDRLVINATTAGRCYGMFYIAVYGYRDSEYELFARASNGRAPYLLDKIPVTDAVYERQYDYFQFEVPSSSADVKFTVTPTHGDPDIYIDCTIPDRSRHRWHSMATTGKKDQISISHTESGACHAMFPPRPYQIAVYGYKYAVFSIVAETIGSDATATRALRSVEARPMEGVKVMEPEPGMQ